MLFNDNSEVVYFLLGHPVYSRVADNHTLRIQ